MAAFYLDTSAIVKRYADENGTTWVTGLFVAPSANEFYTVRLAGPEMISALFRKASRLEMTQLNARRAADKFKKDWQSRYEIIEVSVELLLMPCF
ncbi:MAG: type II toxin-antitoxin system VapC family toxin [Chloroflexi bacterium]|nr:type II toxin-antitoxin system VapC family toxin [Chloroflexota bacterium]